MYTTRAQEANRTQARSFTLDRSSISHSSRTRIFHVSHFSRVENPKGLSQVALFSVGTNYILERIAITPPTMPVEACLGDFPSLHLGVKKEILYLGIKNNDSMKVALDDAIASFIFPPNFQCFSIMHKIIFNVVFPDPFHTHTSCPNSIFQLIACYLPCDPLFSLKDFSTLFPLCCTCAFY